MADMGVSSDLDQAMREAMPFTAILGMRAVTASAEEVKARIDWDASLCTVGGNLHGGLLMALADTCGGWCAYLNLPAGSVGTATIESKTNFLRPVAEGYVEATARPLHVGKTFIVADTELRDDRGRLVARVTQTQAVLRAADTGPAPS
jgi:1,4-dihydroxy-2-naphthoyl-CoA hydrolase